MCLISISQKRRIRVVDVVVVHIPVAVIPVAPVSGTVAVRRLTIIFLSNYFCLSISLSIIPFINALSSEISFPQLSHFLESSSVYNFKRETWELKHSK